MALNTGCWDTSYEAHRLYVDEYLTAFTASRRRKRKRPPPNNWIVAILSWVSL